MKSKALGIIVVLALYAGWVLLMLWLKVENLDVIIYSASFGAIFVIILIYAILKGK